MTGVPVSTLTLILMALASITAGGAIYFGTLSVLSRRGGSLRRTLAEAVAETGYNPEQASEQSEASASVPGILRRLVSYSRQLAKSNLFQAVVNVLAAPSRTEHLRFKLMRAGWLTLFTAQEFVGAQILGALLVAMVVALYALFLTALAPERLQESLGIGLIISVVGALVTYRMVEAFLTARIEQRQKRARLDLPRAVDILVVAVEAGLSLDKAIELYCERFSGPLTDEFRAVQQDILVGRRRREALSGMAERLGLDEVSLLATAILQAERFGVSIAQVLHAQSADLKIRRNQWIREQTLQAPVKMIVPITLFILPAIICVVTGPLIVQFFRNQLF